MAGLLPDTFKEGGALQKAYIRIQKSSLQKAQSDIPARAAEILKGAAAGQAEEENSFQFIVPFNPSELSFTAKGGGKEKKVNFQMQENGSYAQTYVYETVTPMVDMKVKLIFDRTLYQDDSVQPEVEGFVSAVRNPATRNVTFCWNKFQFRGTLSSVSAQYTMFSSAGSPQRAEVEIDIAGKKEQVDSLERDYQRLMGY